MLKFAAICPHPPILIPEIEDDKKFLFKKTIAALEKLAEELKKSGCGTIVVISPHGPMRYDKFTVNLEEKFYGHFSDYGENYTEYAFENNVALARKIFKATKENNFPVEPIRESNIDRGTLIPLHYLTQFMTQAPEIIMLTFTALDPEVHFEYGKILGKILKQADEPIAVIASADLSHRISEESPAGFSPYGFKFDETILSLLKKNENEKIMRINPEFCEEAAECGYKSILIALGILSEGHSTFEQYSYETPFGVGYLVGKWKFR